MITFKRTFHPVGQGAFFTEQFYEGKGEKQLYNVVYDCGSLSSGIKDQMEHIIRDCFHDRKKIDILFLSHFDDDHVNYVEYLEQQGYLNETKVFIPMLEDEEWLSITPYKANYDYVLSLNDKGAKVIKVSPEGGDITPEYTPISEITGDSISGNKRICPDFVYTSDNKPIWFYIPINVRFDSLIKEFKKALGNAGLSYDKLRDKDYVFANYDELKRIYQGLSGKEPGCTAINLNSLLVMSLPGDTNLLTDCYEGYRIIRYYWRFYRGVWGSCLYTGDTSIGDATVWNRIENIINQCIASDKRLHLMQIPHHGSKYCYDDKFLQSKQISNGFTNYDPNYRQHIFDVNLPMKVILNRKVFIGVTREFASQFEEYLMLKI